MTIHIPVVNVDADLSKEKLEDHAGSLTAIGLDRAARVLRALGGAVSELEGATGSLVFAVNDGRISFRLDVNPQGQLANDASCTLGESGETKAAGPAVSIDVLSDDQRTKLDQALSRDERLTLRHMLSVHKESNRGVTKEQIRCAIGLHDTRVYRIFELLGELGLIDFRKKRNPSTNNLTPLGIQVASDEFLTKVHIPSAQEVRDMKKTSGLHSEILMSLSLLDPGQWMQVHILSKSLKQSVNTVNSQLGRLFQAGFIERTIDVDTLSCRMVPKVHSLWRES